MICYLSRNYKGVNNAANKAKTDIEYIMEQCGYRNVGLKQFDGKMDFLLFKSKT